MDYLDKLIDLLVPDTDTDLDSGLDDTVLPADPLELARYQLAAARTNFWEGPTGTFRGCGNRFGCGYAEATATVDPETGCASACIHTNLRVTPQNIEAARRLCRRLNQAFVIPGLAIDDSGELVFATARPYPLITMDITELLGKGFSTVHGNAHIVAQIEAGVPAWDILATVE